MNAYDLMTAAQVAEALAVVEPNRHDRSKTRRAVLSVLEPLEALPGATWQYKWMAANADEKVRDFLLTPFDQTLKSRRIAMQRGLRVLIHAGIIRPGLTATLHRPIAMMLRAAIEPRHGADFDRVVEQATRDANMVATKAYEIRNACAAMVMFTGKRLADITPREWVAAQRAREDLLATDPTLPADREKANRKLLTLRTAYASCALANVISPDPDPAPGMAAVPPTLDRAKRQPTTLETLMDRHARSMPPRLRALVFAVLSIDNAVDLSTLKGMITALNTYIEFITMELPGHDSLEIPIEVRDRLLRRIRTSDAKSRAPHTKRTSIAHLLGRVNAFYSQAAWVVGRYGLIEHQATLGVFPWSPATLKKLRKNERAHREARLTAEVLDQIHHLDGIVAAANAMVDEADALAAAAHAADPGSTFVFRDKTYRRAANAHPRCGTGRNPVTVTATGKAPYRDVDLCAFRAAQIRTLATVLRETGVRAEELSDLALDHLIHVTDGDLTFPALNVLPSKQDRGRVIVLHPDVLSAVHDLKQRAEALWGHYPNVSRLDWHEGEDLPEARLLFFIHRNRTFTGVSQQAVQHWLQTAVDYYDTHMNTGVPLRKVRPHQMRRMFASDLADRGAHPVAVQKTLGHKRLQTTSIYIKADQVSVIARVTEARRNSTSSALRDGEPEDTPTDT